MIHFRRCDEPLGTTPERWHVEFYEDAGPFPIGVAYVAVVDGVALLQFICVADAWRRQGIGRQLLAAITDRWGEPQTSEPMGHEGEALLRACLTQWREAADEA